MKYFITAFLTITLYLKVGSQVNCNVFLWEGDTLQYKACKLSEKFSNFYQFDMEGLAILDTCLQICPYFADAHYEYGVVYLKAGNFVEWDRYINNAVKYDSINYLGLRASCRGKFFADYEGAIQDIDSLDMLLDYDIGFVHDGAYHLDAYKALCYKAMNKNEIAIELFENHLTKNPEYIGLFDHLHLGVAYQNLGDQLKAIENFSKQESINNLAENNYYKAKSYLEIGDMSNFEKFINIAASLLSKQQKMIDGFHVMEDEIFISDIKKLKESVDK